MRTIIISFSIFFLFSCKASNKKNNDLIAYWSFDDKGLAVVESSGTNLVTLNKGATQVEGYRGKAMKFNGSSILEVKYNPVLDNFSKGITVSAWIKKDTASGWKTVLSREIDSTWSEYFGLAVFKNHALFSIDTDGKSYVNIMDKDTVVPYKWTHLAGTYNNDTLKLYVNGKLIKSGVCKGPVSFLDNNPLLIGGNSNNKNLTLVDCFNGFLDEIRIYNRALNEKEIKTLLNQ